MVHTDKRERKRGTHTTYVAKKKDTTTTGLVIMINVCLLTLQVMDTYSYYVLTRTYSYTVNTYTYAC